MLIIYICRWEGSIHIHTYICTCVFFYLAFAGVLTFATAAVVGPAIMLIVFSIIICLFIIISLSPTML